MCIFAHGKWQIIFCYVHFCMFTELSQKGEHIINIKLTKKEYFTRFPNEYIQGNIKTK